MSVIHEIEKQLFERYPDLESVRDSFHAAYELLLGCYQSGGKTLICGNGGSAADSDHIVGELMKGFMLSRPIPSEVRHKLQQRFGEDGSWIGDHLQGALPSISLVQHPAFTSAFTNDVAAETSFAQQVYGYGSAGDVVILLSTSGQSRNVVMAAKVAAVMGLRTLALTGGDGGVLLELCDVTVNVPYSSTPLIQERHLPIYHALCMMLEEAFFGDEAYSRN